MTDIYEQKKWERDMVSLGITRFRAQQDEALGAERFTETSAGSRLLKAYISQVSAAIAEKQSQTVGRRSMYLKLIQGMDPDKLALFTLHTVVGTVFVPSSVQSSAATIGKMVEDELRFSKFETETPEFYNSIIRDLDNKNSTAYRHRHRVLVSRMNDREIEWHCWTNAQHIGVGLLLLTVAENSCDLIERKLVNGTTIFAPTEEVIEWIKKHNDAMELLMPDRMPTIIEPDPWLNWKEGGFYSNRLRKLTPLVKTRDGQQHDIQSELLDTCSMPVVLSSINGMQGTSWAINQDIIKVVKEVWDRGLEVGMPRSQPYEIPTSPVNGNVPAKNLSPEDQEALAEWKAIARSLYEMEAQRKAGLMNIVRTMRLAERMKTYELLWIVYQMDFRGRTYSTTTGLSPQGADISKAALHFGRPEPLGDRGWFWFRVHGANKYGNDKGRYEDRVLWVDSNSDHFIAAGLDPLAHTEVWKDADKPYQFLAWCMEYARACTGGDPTKFASRLPIALDGSCNGLQHFSAMLRDPVGGASVNVSPGERPADIYQDVADVATRELREIVTDPSHEHYAIAANWLALFEHLEPGKGMSRKLSKKPVMTLPYGSTQQTCTQSVYQWYIDLNIEFFPKNTAFKHSIFLAGVLWKSIGKVVVAARAAMSWLQKVARILGKSDMPIVWHTPLGFPLVQASPVMETTRVETLIGGRLQVQIRVEHPGVDPYRAALGASPNFVHAVDATHMHMTVAECRRRGIDHFAMIHDDYGVHACHVDTLHAVIREEFLRLHSTDLLADLKQQLEERYGVELPELPAQGDLDLSSVLHSDFFFG